MINYAHRGASEYAPENTLMSFYLGLYMGANGIETDVQKTKDNVLVLFHDDTLKRVTGEEGKISDYTFDELKSFTVKNGNLEDKIISLEEFFERFASKDITFAIELKTVGIARETIEIIKKFNIQSKCIITSFIFENLKEVKEIDSSIRVGYLLFYFDEKTLNEIKSINLYEVCPKADILDKMIVKYWKDKGYSVRAWGVQNQKIMKKMVKIGVDGMTVNFPDKLTKILGRKENF